MPDRSVEEERLRSVNERIQHELEEALSCLERPRGEDPKRDDARRSGMQHLGTAGGLAFSFRLTGIGTATLFDDISDAAEQRDLDQIGRIQRAVAARLSADRPPDEPSPGRGGLDLEAGPLQMLAVLNEARTARKAGDAVRYSLMAGFLVGLVSGEWGLGIRYEHGYLKDAVLAALDRDREGAGSWVQADWFEVWDRRGESVDADPRVLLLQWVGDRLTAAHRMSCPTFLHSANETEDERRAREATEREYCDREEASIQRAQNFGKRIAGPDREGICVPASYSLNRALVLESQEKGRPGRPRPRGVTVKTTPARAACGGSFQAQRKRWPPLGRSPKSPQTPK